MSAGEPQRAAPAPPRPPWTMLSALWTTQYVGIGFLTVGLTAILRDGGASLETIALVSLIGLLWPLRLVWAPLVDRYGSRRHGHHRSWLLVMQSGMVLCLLALLAFPDPARSLAAVLVVCAVFVVFSATQDVAADALAVRLLRPADRGLGNGVQVAGTYAGTVLGGGACVLVYDRFGWTPAVLLLAAITLVALVNVALFHEPARERRASTGQVWGAVASVFAVSRVRGWALVAVPLLYGGSAGLYALVNPALVDAGWSLERVGVVTGIVVSVPALLAGVVAGALVGRLGRPRVLLLGGGALVVSGVGLGPLLTGSAPLVATVVALSGFLVAYTALNVVVYTVIMDLCRPETGGTDFTVLTTVPLVVSFATAAGALWVAGSVGYPTSAALSCALALAGVVLGLRWLRVQGGGEAARGAARLVVPEP